MSAMSPLEQDIRRRIEAAGPMPISDYMALCLTHPQYGYYVTRDPLGADGDFITSPEISQMFGELIGLWAVAAWRQMGAPAHLRLVELGPGRGTLMKDALRAAQAVPEFIEAAAIHLVEINPALRAKQAETLSGLRYPPDWHDDITTVPAGPVIVIANEFFDALPVHQAIRQNGRWHTRTVRVADGMLTYGVSEEPIPHFEITLPELVRQAGDGEIFEWRSAKPVLDLTRRIVTQGGAALVIDYGHADSATGDTFQAAMRHAFSDPLHAPGEADLTAHVDFQAMAHAAETLTARTFGPMTQGEFLRRLGIAQRADALKANANRAQRQDIDLAVERLTGHGRNLMGELFKVMAIADPRLTTVPGFEK